MRFLLRGVAAVVLATAGLAGASVATGYEGLSNWSDLPNLMPGSSGLASSYNRSLNTRFDYSNFDSVSGDGYGLVKEITGASGAITRFWMPHLIADSQVDLRVTIDGTVYQTTALDVFNGNFGGAPRFQAPLTTTLLGGRATYEPITFQNSIKIEMKGTGQALFYQFDYRTYPTGRTAPSFGGGLTAAQVSARAAAVTALTNVGQNPAGVDPAATTVAQTSLNVPAKSSVTIANVTGSGQIRSLLLKMRDASPGSAPSDATLDNLFVRVKYDGAADYAIDVPASHFFGVGHQRVDYKSLPLGVASDGSYYSHWPMPYRQGVTVELYNNALTDVVVPSASVEYKSGPVAADAAYLHAKVTQATTAAGQSQVRLLSITGEGHYVGNILWTSGGFDTLEGNDIITVDGSNVLRGTGLEDAYNGGYYYQHVGLSSYEISDHGDIPNASSGILPQSGLLTWYGQGQAEQYRFRLNDAVSFTDGLTLDMENVDNIAGVNWGMTGFYYLSVPEPSCGAVGLGASLLMLRRRRSVTRC